MEQRWLRCFAPDAMVGSAAKQVVAQKIASRHGSLRNAPRLAACTRSGRVRAFGRALLLVLNIT